VTLPALPLPAIRDALPVLATEAYLNTGGAGPLPLAAARAIERATHAALTRGRAGRAAYEEFTQNHDALRAAVADTLSADSDEIAIASSSTQAMNAFIWGIDWQAGDEIITTNLEHPGLSVPLRAVADRHGVTLHMLELALGDEDLEPLVRAVAGPRTRLVALSHVSWATGARMDVEGAARAARDIGALTLVDGAQGAGAIPTDPRALGADGYAVAGHKWLLGPEGLGALWVRRESTDRLGISFSGYNSGTDHQVDGHVTIHAGGRRLEISTQAEILIPGWLASLRWLDELGWPSIYERVLTAAAGARERLQVIPDVEVITPEHRQAGLVTFTVPGVPPEAADERLFSLGVTARWLPAPAALRVATGFFTDESDLDRLAAAVALIASGK
jgi:L-cysteine/cystine lyase